MGGRGRDARSGVPGRRAAPGAHPPVQVTLQVTLPTGCPSRTRAERTCAGTPVAGERGCTMGCTVSPLRRSQGGCKGMEGDWGGWMRRRGEATGDPPLHIYVGASVARRVSEYSRMYVVSLSIAAPGVWHTAPLMDAAADGPAVVAALLAGAVCDVLLQMCAAAWRSEIPAGVSR